jgi:hypothetical protein
MTTNKNNIVSSERNTFWLNDITILYKNGAYANFVPTKNMTRVEQLNALTRFCFYLIIVLFIFDKTDEWMFVPLIAIILFIVLYNVYDSDEYGKSKDLLKMKNIQEQSRNYTQDNESTLHNNNSQNTRCTDESCSNNDNESDNESDIVKKDYNIEIGYYDSNGKLNYSRGYQKPKHGAIEAKYTMDEMRIYDSNKCRLPTEDNPFMNPTVDDFNKENVPVACNVDDDEIKNIGKKINDSFNADLYRDIEDVFNKKNSQRQFFTVAHSVPNDQEAFARWCYKFPPTCKTNQERCLRYQDLRVKYE